MNKTIHLIMSVAMALAMTLGGFYNVGAATTNTYYVSQGGSDTNAGTLASPFKTITKAISVAQAGNFIYVRSGTYPSFSITKSGAANNYLTISGYPGERPIISGGSQSIRVGGVSYVVVKGFEVLGASGSNVAGIFIAMNSNYNIIEENTIHDNLGDGIIIDNGHDNKIINNIVYNNRTVGIKVRGTSINNEITGNTVYHQVGDPPNSDGIAVTGESSYSLVKNNMVYDNADDGIDTWSSHHNTLIGNIVYNQRGDGDGNGFKLGGTITGGHNTVIGNVSYNNKRDGFDSNHSGGNVYYNNVAYANGSVGFEDVAKFTGMDTSTYINNIGYNNNVRNFSASSFTAVSHNNIWYSDSGEANVNYEGVRHSTLASFFAASGNRLDNPNGGLLSSLQVNPQFTNPLGLIFTLKSLSPAIDKGDAANPGQVIAMNRVDIGAFESGSSSSPTPVALTQTAAATYTSTAVFASPTSTQTTAFPTVTPTSIFLPASPTSTLGVVASPTTMTTATALMLPTSTSTPVLSMGIPSATPMSQSLSEITFDNKDRSFTYSSGWKIVSTSKAYKGSYRETTTNNATAKFVFTGQSFSILYKGGLTFSKLDVYVDGILVGTLNQKLTATTYQSRWDYPGQLAFGPHTLKLVFKVTSATINRGSLDAIIVRSTDQTGLQTSTPTSTQIASPTLILPTATPTSTQVIWPTPILPTVTQTFIPPSVIPSETPLPEWTTPTPTSTP